ncbi:protein of unknown function [Taphrina deformans PYCC 5710]|uniref:Zn(2)-C6 fungal-type domain-containing protein n=1 Tax=Taphrina deformans (strain PYCC 5710 / ATCC 11124 / CBS 356.35 / IMI 108563 / JCM 9778 / NBRC 8474) TaxID=1097556 RepID=R4XDD0_TAPDE|nr:protein of unknown function [Taphrina deformans PYCC 5710]|eukprot:CCG83886.1 protein of unknown function [Taphrina deformans PYCC 5710]
MIQLESDLRMAAELGQHLLKRHDDYVVEVQKERQGFLIDIERQSNFAKLVDELETNNRLLELQNEQTMRENLTLLKRLEDLNSSLNIADTRNHELRTNLLDAETTVGRLSHRATKAQGLEAQIATAELEREVLERDVAALSVNSHQSDVRYRKAEKRIQALQRQLDTIAIEVPELKQQSVLSRAVEETTLKAPSNISRSDVLEDHSVLETVDSLVLSNTSLEYNNAELQRVLASAQDEVVMLREKLASHERTRSTSSMIDNDRVPRKSISQELHQHNHYHYHIKKPLSKRDSLNKETPTARSRSATDPRQTKSTASTASHGRLKDRVREPEPVRTPIKTKTQLGMCNRCRRRKIKCSGSVDGGSCEGCTRANGVECVFADRPLPTKDTPSYYASGDSKSNNNNNNTTPTSTPLQPPEPSRSASLPVQTVHRPAVERPSRSTAAVSRLSGDAGSAKVTSPTRSAGTASPTMSYIMSPPGATKRQSLSAASHPYQRPSSGGGRKGSSDSVSSNLLRYSQSLIQAQAQQLSGRTQPPVAQSRAGSCSGPTSMPKAYNYINMGASSFQLQQPNFRQPDYSRGPSPAMAADYSIPADYHTPGAGYGLRGAGTPDSVAYSPVFQPGMYPSSTPELVSSDSFSTVDSTSSLSLHTDLHTSMAAQQQQQQLQQQPQIGSLMPYMNQAYPTQQQQPYMTQSPTYLSFDLPASGMQTIDPNQWTPGVDKIANQWLQFSPQQTGQFF